MPLSETGVLTSTTAQPGLVEPGAGNVLLLGTPPSVVTGKTLPLIAHVYTTAGVFKQLLHPILNRPTLKQTMNAIGHPVTIEVATGSASPSVSWGDLIKLTSLGDSSVLYTGIVEDIVEDYSDKPSHIIELQPLGTELGDTYFSNSYVNPTDAGTMVRDAVNQTAHLISTPMSVPLSGQLGIINFSNTTCLAVLNDAVKIAGPNWWWAVDPTGIVWFQQYGVNAPPAYTVKQGQDYTARKFTSPIGKLKNKVIAVGGVPTGGSAPKVSTYSDSASQASYGVRALMPPLNYPTVTDQPTLDAITNTVGVGLNRKIARVSLTLTNYPNRVVIGQQNPTLRYWEPASYPIPQSYTGAGGYSPNYVVLEVENDGPTQRVVVGDIPTAADDYQYQIAQIIQRTSVSNLTYTPASLNIMGTLQGGGIQTSNNPGDAKWVIDGTSIRAIDPGGVIRVEEGNLGTNGISQAGWKFRANDATGVPVFDSDGLIKVMSLLGSIFFDGGSATFSLPRQTTVLILGYETRASTGPAGSATASESPAMILDGIYNLGFHAYGYAVLSSPYQFVITLAAGSHTLVHQSFGGSPPAIASMEIDVFQIGG